MFHARLNDSNFEKRISQLSGTERTIILFFIRSFFAIFSISVLFLFLDISILPKKIVSHVLVNIDVYVEGTSIEPLQVAVSHVSFLITIIVIHIVAVFSLILTIISYALVYRYTVKDFNRETWIAAFVFFAMCMWSIFFYKSTLSSQGVEKLLSVSFKLMQDILSKNPIDTLCVIFALTLIIQFGTQFLFMLYFFVCHQISVGMQPALQSEMIESDNLGSETRARRKGHG